MPELIKAEALKVVEQAVEELDADARERARDVDRHWLQVDGAAQLRAAAEVAQGELVETGLEPERAMREAWVAAQRQKGRAEMQAAAQIASVAAAPRRAREPVGERRATLREWQQGALLIKRQGLRAEVVKRDGAAADRAKLRQEIDRAEADVEPTVRPEQAEPSEVGDERVVPVKGLARR